MAVPHAQRSVYAGVAFGLSRAVMKFELALRRWPAGLVTAVLSGLLSVHAAAPVVISEFMAKSSDEFVDEENDPTDWIEARNVSGQAVDLDGWFLTDSPDDPRRWQFPATQLLAGQHIVVFASGKDRSTPGRPLHTNFRLDADGEYLALLMPDGVSVATEFSPTFPEQSAGISYGTGLKEKRRLLTEFLPQRTDRVIRQFIRAGLYPELPGAVMNRTSGVFDHPFQLTLDAPSERNCLICPANYAESI